MVRPRGSGVVPREDRFWPKVERRSRSECWPWTGATVRSRGGLRYGKFFWGPEQGQLVLAHRAAFYLVHDRWPEPQALHGCDFSLCCNAENPEHVHEGTAAENTRQMFARGRHPGPPVLMGERANRAKLTDVQALEIIERYRAGGISQDMLAVEYGVSQHSISLIVRGRRRSLQ